MQMSASVGHHPDLFTQVPCTLCGGADYEIVSPARFDQDVTSDDLRKVYSASSDHILLDQLVRCHSCGLVYVNPRIEESALLESYASAVDPVFVSQNSERVATFKRSLKWICKAAGVVPSRELSLLDVGCAGGAFLKAASDFGFKVTGIEPSRWMGDYARSLYNVNVQEGTLTQDMFRRETFDIVTLWDVIEHLSHPHEVLQTVHDCLKPGGLLVVTYPDIGSTAARILGSHWPFYLSVHLSYYNRETMREQLRRASFNVLHMRAYWQSLTFGYLFTRLSKYLPVSRLSPFVHRSTLGSISITYNMGQTLVIATKAR